MVVASSSSSNIYLFEANHTQKKQKIKTNWIMISLL